MIIIDCINKKIGRIISTVSKILIYFNFIDKKIKIFLINSINFNFGKKIYFTSHSGYIGNIKKKKKELNKIKFIKKIIYNMLPKNSSRINILKKIFIIL